MQRELRVLVGVRLVNRAGVRPIDLQSDRE